MPWRSWYDARPKSERHEATEPWRNRVSAGDTASWWSVVDNLRLGCSTPRAAASMNHVPDRKIGRSAAEQRTPPFDLRRFCSVPLVPSDGSAFICWLAATRTTAQADLRIDQAVHLQAVYRKKRGSRRRRQELPFAKKGIFAGVHGSTGRIVAQRFRPRRSTDCMRAGA
ncbi:hypothetical protein BN1723_009018 [Verticillium longisporum]|uniref:Uncharacterized protein n=1 Tax=Verticillium longisporum TaxID=100787 RepID=A0A0G4KL41_VERLO|nr:hypothetical protein BN1723_009018 [Verticillium longisporum]